MTTPSQHRRHPKAGWVNKPDGHCRKCGGDLTGRRRTFCSERCIHTWKIASNPGYARDQVRLRDHGICVMCHPNQQQLIATARAEVQACMDACFPLIRKSRELKIFAKSVSFMLAPYRAVRPEAKGFGHAWEMDHSRAVIEGGGVPEDLTNVTAEELLSKLRSLCLSHHSEQTKALAARRAVIRKQKLSKQEP